MLLHTHVTLFNSESSLPRLKTDLGISFSFLFFKATLCSLRPAGSSFPTQGLNLHPLYWER